MINRSVSTLIAGLVFVGLGCLFLAVNLNRVEVDWWMAVRLIIPALFIWGGALKLWRHFTWPLDKLRDKPGKAGLLSGIFWLSLGLVITLAVFDQLDFLPAAGMYWPVLLLVFGLGKILDFFRMKEIARSNFSEITGVIFIILLGLGCMKLHQLNVLILEQDPFWERIPEFIGIEELIEPAVEHSSFQDFDLAGATAIEIRNAYGNIIVEGVAESEDGISAELVLSLRENDEIRAQSIFDQVKIEAVEENGVLVLLTNRRELKSLGKRLTTTLNLKIPENLKLKVVNDYGDMNVSGIKNDCTLNAKKGEVEASSIQGMLTVTCDSEMITLNGVDGDIDVDAKFTEVDIDEVHGNVSIQTSHKQVNVSRIEGNLNVENRHDDVTASDITGTVDINNPGGEVVLSGISGEINVVNSKGDVQITDSSGPVVLSTAYGDVDLENLEADVEVTARYADIEGRGFDSNVILRGESTAVNLENLQGDLLVETSHKPVSVSDARGSVNIQNDLGPVHLRLLEDPSSAIRLESRQGDIKLELPGEAGFALDARVTNGKIVSEFGAAPEQDSRGDSVFEKSIGGGGPKINISTSGSVIEIRRIQ